MRHFVHFIDTLLHVYFLTKVAFHMNVFQIDCRNIRLQSKMLKMHGVAAEVQFAVWKEYNKRIRLMCSLTVPFLTLYTSFELTSRLT
jgi:hypothetical protein